MQRLFLCLLQAWKCTKIGFGRGFAPDPTGEAYSAPSTPSWWGGGSQRSPQEPHPLLGPSGFDHTGYAVSSPTPPKINPSYGLVSKHICFLLLVFFLFLHFLVVGSMR